ncbi:hypothetical protein JTB14_035389 [Gonioctena quinquepunctata]|nr:hypothetical protein JTB14_035389 [Gonioctena quinquepunctata]
MSERKKDYPSGAMKKKCKQKKEEVIEKLPKISTFFQQSASVSDLDCNGISGYTMVQAYENFEIRRPKTEDIIDIKNGGRTTPGLVTTRESIDSIVSHAFQFLQRIGTRVPLPSSNSPAYAGKVPINEKRM